MRLVEAQQQHNAHRQMMEAEELKLNKWMEKQFVLSAAGVQRLGGMHNGATDWAPERN